MRLSDEIKAAVSLKAVVDRDVEWSARKSRPRAGDWWACCPFHAEASPSFHVVEPNGSGGFFHCFGCHASGSVIDYVMQRDGVDARAAMKALADGAGLERREDDPAREAREKEAAAKREKEEARRAETAARRQVRAVEIWRAAVPDAPLLRDYLEARGVRTDALRALFPAGVPPTLRLAPALEHWREGSDPRRDPPDHVGPAMVGLIGDRARGLLGVHRTWITAAGRARYSDGEKVPKQWLGRTGEIWGAPVKLSPEAPVLYVGEGIETALAALAIALEDGLEDVAAEAALTRGALAGPADPRGRGPGRDRDGKPLPSPLPDLGAPRRGWLPPEGVREVVILGEGSSKHPATAERETRRALAKVRAALPSWATARIALPGGRWDQDLDLADLAADREV